MPRRDQHAGRGSGSGGGFRRRTRSPPRDYGACLRDNRHAFASSANVEVWRGLGAGISFRAYSGYPINETIGSDVNGDGINNDRPVRGVTT